MVASDLRLDEPGAGDDEREAGGEGGRVGGSGAARLPRICGQERAVSHAEEDRMISGLDL